MLFSTFLCQGKFVHRYVHPVPTYIFLYVKKSALSVFDKTFTQQQSIAGTTSPLVVLRSSAIIPLPSPHSSLPTPVSHSCLPSHSISILFGLLSCCLIVLASRHVVLHRRVSSHCIVSSRIISSLRCVFASRCACFVQLVLV